MVGTVNVPGQQFNYGQYTPPAPAPAGPAGATAPTGAGGLAGGAPPPQPAALGAALKAVLGDLTPTGDASSGAGASEAQAEHLESILSSSVSGDTATYLARAMLKFYSEQRHEAVVDRQTLGLEAQSELMSSAAQLDKEANKMMSAALVSLVTTCVASAITIGTSAVGAALKGLAIGKEMSALKNEMSAMKNLESAEGALGEVEDVAKDPAFKDDATAQKMLSNLNTEAKANLDAAKGQLATAEKQTKQVFGIWDKVAEIGGDVVNIGNSTGKIVSAGGEFFSKMTDADVKHMEADAKRMDAMAENFRTQADAKKAIVEALDDMIHQTLSFVKDMADAKADRMRSIARA